MSKKVFIAFAHPKYKSGESFNSCVRDEFIKSSKERNFEIDLMNIYEEKTIKFWDGSPPDNQILDIQNRMEKADIIFLLSPCHNFTMVAAMENMLSHVISPPFAFKYKKIIGNWGAPQHGKLKNKKVVIGMTYGSPSPIITFAVHQIPRRIKKMVFKHLCGCDVQYLRMYEVLPNMPQKVFEKHMKSVRKLVRGL